MNAINCMECGRPWGVILERGVLPSDELQRLAQREMEDRILEHIPFFWIKRDELDLSFLPQVEPDEVVFVSRSLCDFASEKFNASAPEGPCWIRANGDGYEMPAWLLKNRKHRWAYTWNCCNIDLWRSTLKKA